MHDTPHDPTQTKRPDLPLLELFLGFAKISVTGFGMILPWARRLIVEDKKWLTADEFNETYSLAQFLPGPNVVNMSVVFGSRMRGPAGAAVALLGLIGPPALIATALSALYAIYGDVDVLRRILTGIAAAAIGLMIAVIVKMAEPLLRKLLAPAPLVLIATFLTVGVARWPLVSTLLVLAPASIALAFWWQRR
ncbi:chromate transporter [Pseudorhodoplanes sp.]|uniref:chromate transporter n=1 Tax=Pseudorhodoplanes sp. TaxID=1934341 RepID=UPI002C4376F1|nr:chromate transporter [Pseudorhodoplanes sp.]HWV52705.1 chromate transporter [Pseudorhodoplanes sp.]